MAVAEAVLSPVTAPVERAAVAGRPRGLSALRVTAAFLAAIAAVPARSAEVLAGYVSVYDGDRIVIRGKRVHFAGVDAPERGQTCAAADGQLYACGRNAEWALAEKVADRSVSCDVHREDGAYPLVGLCRLGDEDLGAWLVERGLAVADRSLSGSYGPQEEAARQAKRGLWAGTFTQPSAFRSGVRGRPDGYAMAAEARPPVEPNGSERDCRIKGNITSEGTKLYWVPGSRRYAETVITEATGERWFCSEGDAKAAGWTEPRR